MTRARGPTGAGHVHQSAAGTWWVQHARTVGGQRRRWRDGPYATRGDALAAQAARATVRPDQRPDLTWDRWLDQWGAAAVPDLLAGGQTAYAGYVERVLRLHLIPHLRGLRLAASTPADIDRAWQDLLARGLARKYVTNIRGVAHLAGVEAMRRGYLDRDVIGLSRLPRRRSNDRQPARPEILTPDEATRLATWCIDHLNDDGPPWPLATLIALETGARRGEVLGLRWSDFDPDASLLTIARQVAQATGPRGTTTTVKGLKMEAAGRTITIGPRLADALRRHRRRTGGVGGRYLLADTDGGHLCPDTMSTQVPRVALSAGIARRVTPHMLRHTHVSLLLAAGLADVAIAARVGHSTTATTRNIYAHALPATHDTLGADWERLTGGDAR